MPRESTSLTNFTSTATRPRSDHRCVPLLPTLLIPPSMKSGWWYWFCKPFPWESLQRHFPGGQMDFRVGFFTQCRQEALMEELWLSPCSHRWSCHEGLPFRKGPTLFIWHLWQHPLCSHLNFSASRAKTRSYLTPWCEARRRDFGTDAAEQPWPPQPLSPPSSALPACLQDSWIRTATNDKVATLLHQDFIFQAHSPSAPRTMSSATQRQGRCHQTSSRDPLIPAKPTLAPGLHRQNNFDWWETHRHQGSPILPVCETGISPAASIQLWGNTRASQRCFPLRKILFHPA